MIAKGIRKRLSKNRFSVSLLLSLALHAIVLWGLQIPKPTPEKKKPKKHTVQVQIKKPDDSNDFIDDTLSMDATVACPRSYVGIGFKYWTLTNEISEIAPNSPAERIGLRAGDVIISMTNTHNRSVGDVFSITIVRNERVFTFETKLEDICTK